MGDWEAARWPSSKMSGCLVGVSAYICVGLLKIYFLTHPCWILKKVSRNQFSSSLSANQTLIRWKLQGTQAHPKGSKVSLISEFLLKLSPSKHPHFMPLTLILIQQDICSLPPVTAPYPIEVTFLKRSLQNVAFEVLTFLTIPSPFIAALSYFFWMAASVELFIIHGSFEQGRHFFSKRKPEMILR